MLVGNFQKNCEVVPSGTVKLIVKNLPSYFVGRKVPTVDLLNKLISGYQMVYFAPAEHLYLPIWEKLPFALWSKGLRLNILRGTKTTFYP